MVARISRSRTVLRSDEASKKAEGRQYFITKCSGAGATAS